MAFGFPPSYTREFSQQLPKEHFLVLAHETLQKLDYTILAISATTLVATATDDKRLETSTLTIEFFEGIATIRSFSNDENLLDLGRNSRIVFRFISSFHQIKEGFDSLSAHAKYALIEPQMMPELEIVHLLKQPDFNHYLKVVTSFFVPGKSHFVTPLLISINFSIFFMMVFSGGQIFSPDTDVVVQWGANFRPETVSGQPWRLITSVFLHLGLMHLVINMISLLFAGWILEPMIGKFRMILCYILAGIGASTLSMWWHAFTVSAGASGAIFGLYGVLFVLLATRVVNNNLRKTLLPGISVYIAYNLVTGLQDGVDNAAHLGGLITGLLSGLALIPALDKKDTNILKFSPAAIMAAAVPVCSYLLYTSIAGSTKIYVAKMKQFDEMESLALEVYTYTPETSKNELLNEITERSNYYWNENIRLTKEIETLTLGYEVKQRNKKLRKYCQLYLGMNNLLYKTLQKDTDEYGDQVFLYRQQIDEIKSELR